MPPVKLTLIGAGSRFTFCVVSDVIRIPGLAGSVLSLVDTDPDALDLSDRIARRMIDQTGAGLRVESTIDRREALPGSDFVLITISVGEPWARERDVEIGERYGIHQPTSQTVGPAGYMRGMRVVPEAVAIGQDIARLCPDAKVLEADEDSLDCLSVGTNHLTWALALRHEGQDRLPEFLERITGPEGKEALASVPVSREIYEAFGLWPTGTEDHIAEFFPYFLTPETRGGEDYGLTTRHVTEEQMAQRRSEREAMADGRASIENLLKPSGESAMEIVSAALGLSEPATHVVNVPNGDLIENLPADAIVEVPGRVSPSGIEGTRVGSLPQPVAHILSTRALQQEILVDAALSGDGQKALQGLLLDAQIVSLDAAREILDLSIRANAEWLPGFAH
ncbi:MAG: hypothetical protein QGI83_13920 [Candidatus Latescibacteria bacterium]|nr:hypothetical protein [Candidatus Latescibacterota bacterium]